MFFDSDSLKNLAEQINNIKELVQTGFILSPNELELIKEMRDNLNDIIVEDMYR